MGYYMRYIVSGEQPVTIADVERAFRAADAGYRCEPFDAEITIHHDDDQLAHVTLNVPGDGLFEDECEELLEAAEDGHGRGKARVLETLRAARQIVAVQVLHGTGEVGSTLDLIGPLWDWLSENRTGMIQADAEGYYEDDELILAAE